MFCPPKEKCPAEIGAHLDLTLRIPTDTVTYRLQLDDTVALPGATVLHLGKRHDDANAHGRLIKRHDVEIVGFVSRVDMEDAPPTPMPCRLLDISMGGARMVCPYPIATGSRVDLDIFLDDGVSEPLSTACDVRWMEVLPEGTVSASTSAPLPLPSRSAWNRRS